LHALISEEVFHCSLESRGVLVLEEMGIDEGGNGSEVAKMRDWWTNGVRVDGGRVSHPEVFFASLRGVLLLILYMPHQLQGHSLFLHHTTNFFVPSVTHLLIARPLRD